MEVAEASIRGRRPSIEYPPEEFKLLLALYRVIAREINAYEVINEERSLSEVIGEIEKLTISVFMIFLSSHT